MTKHNQRKSWSGSQQVFIKLPEVGLGTKKNNRTLMNIVWSNKRLWLDENKPLTTAVAILIIRLFEGNENIMGWPSESAMDADISRASELLAEYFQRPLTKTPRTTKSSKRRNPRAK